MLAPSPFVALWVPRLVPLLPPSPRALDLAMGGGRHAAVLAACGCHTVGVDLSLDAVRTAVAEARSGGLTVHAFCADMTQHPLPREHFHVVVVTRYLDRARMPAITAAVAPGGVILYETFTTDQRRLGRGPTSADHLLEPGELAGWFGDFEVLFAEETQAPDALARIVARR